MRLILSIPADLLQKGGPIAVGKRGGKIYGYDRHGKPIYSAGEVPRPGLAGYSRDQATKKIVDHLKGSGNVRGTGNDAKVQLTGRMAEVLGRKEYAVERLGNLTDASIGKLMGVLGIPPKKEHRGQTGYAERREAVQERKLARAKKLEAEAAAREKAGRTTMEIIPMGQPILVGHHSEKRHRRDLDRMNRNFQAAAEAQREADRLKSAARNPSSAISSDDPEAVVQLKKKVERLEAQRDFRKKLNKVFRKHKGDWERIGPEMGMTPKQVQGWKDAMAQIHWEKMPVPGYELTNLGARIRDAKKRIENLAAEAARPEAKPVEGAGWRIHEDHDDNRIWVTFDKKPPKEVTKEMRFQGFKWSPSRSAWVRQLNNAGRHAAERVATELSKKTLPGAVSPTTDKPVETEQQRRRRLELPHLKTAKKHRSNFVRRHMAAESAMNSATGPANQGLSAEERSKRWNEAAQHLQYSIDNARDGYAAWDEIYAIRQESAPDTKTREDEIKRIERNIALATAKAANPDAHLPMPEGIANDNFTHEANRTRQIQEARLREEKKQRRAENVAKREARRAARGELPKPKPKKKPEAPPDRGRRYEYEALTKPRPAPKKKAAKAGKMKQREKAGQLLLLSRTAQLHLDR